VFLGGVVEEMASIYRGERMGGQLFFFNVTARGTLPFNHPLYLSSSTYLDILLPIIFMVGEWQG
jgi:hypothetical protein